MRRRGSVFDPPALDRSRSAACCSQPMSRISAILFDLGNVIVEVDFRRTFRHWAESAQVEEPFRPSFFSSSPIVNPGAPRSTKNAVKTQSSKWK